MAHHKRFETCPNCGTDVRNVRFCPNCGQENHDLHLPASHIFLEVLENIFHFDTKLWHSLKAIVSHPGQVTIDFIKGKRAYHIPPFRMYVFIAFVFFLLSTIFADKLVDKTKGLDKGVETATNVLLIEKGQSELRPYTHALLPDAEKTRWAAQDQEIVKSVTELLPKDQERMVETYSDALEELKELRAVDSLSRPMPDSTKRSLVLRLKSLSRSLQNTLTKANEHKVLARQGKIVEQDTVHIMGYKFSHDEYEELRHAQDDQLIAFLQKRNITLDPSNLFLFKVEMRWKDAKKKPKELAHVAIKQSSYAMFLLMPLLALLLKWIYFHRKRFYYEHLIFAVHFHAVIYMFLIVLLGLLIWGGESIWVNRGISILSFSTFLYGFMAFYNVYERPVNGEPYPSLWLGLKEATTGKRLLFVLGLMLLSPIFVVAALGLGCLWIGLWLLQIILRFILKPLMATFQQPQVTKVWDFLRWLSDGETLEDFIKYKLILIAYLTLISIAVAVVTALSVSSVH